MQAERSDKKVSRLSFGSISSIFSRGKPREVEEQHVPATADTASSTSADGALSHRFSISEQELSRNVKRSRGVLVFKAHIDVCITQL